MNEFTKMILAFPALALLLSTPAWGEGEPGHVDEGDGHDEHEAVQLTDAELEEFGIEVIPAKAGTIEQYVSLPGEVRPNADRLAHIVPRYSGIVTEVLANIGDHVKRGQALAVIESDESLAPFEMKTMIGGTVIAKHIALGETVSREKDAFIIADLSAVWIELTVYQRDLDRVRVGQKAKIFVGHRLEEESGIVDYITPVVDEVTRTATARVVLRNREGRWRPGMFVTGKVLVDKIDVPLVVPRTALHSVEEQTVVFIETDEGFMPRQVETGRMGDTNVEILSGLSAGTRYVSSGGFTIKAELGKESFGEGHGH